MWTSKLTTCTGSTTFAPETKMSQILNTYSKVYQNHPLANLWYPTKSPTTNSTLSPYRLPSSIREGTNISKEYGTNTPQKIRQEDQTQDHIHQTFRSDHILFPLNILYPSNISRHDVKKHGMTSFTPKYIIISHLKTRQAQGMTSKTWHEVITPLSVIKKQDFTPQTSFYSIISHLKSRLYSTYSTDTLLKVLDLTNIVSHLYIKVVRNCNVN